MNYDEFKENVNSWYNEVVEPKVSNLADDGERKKIFQAVSNAQLMRLNDKDLRALKENDLYCSLRKLIEDFPPFGIKISSQFEDDSFGILFFGVQDKVRALLIDKIQNKESLKILLSNNLQNIPDGDYIATPVSVLECGGIGDGIPFEIIDGDIIIE